MEPLACLFQALCPPESDKGNHERGGERGGKPHDYLSFTIEKAPNPPRPTRRSQDVREKGDLRLCSKDSHRPRLWLAPCWRHRYRQSAWPRIAVVGLEAGAVVFPEDRWEVTAVRVLPAVAAITPRAVLPAEAVTPGGRALRAPADTTDGADTREARATMVAATALHVRTVGPSIADFTAEAFTWVLALLMGTFMTPATSTAPAMPTIQVILTDRPLRRRRVPTAHTISMVLGSLVPTAIPANGNIRLRNRTTIPINGSIRSRSRTTIPTNSNIRSRSRTTIPISLNGTIDNPREACDIRSVF